MPTQGSSRWRRAWDSLARISPQERGRLLSVYARKAIAEILLVVCRGLLFNPVGLWFWVWLLKGQVEFFGSSHTIGDMIIVDYYLKRKRHLRLRVLSAYLIGKPHLANLYLAGFLARTLGDARTYFILNRWLCRLLTPLERPLFFAGPTASFTQHPPEYHELNRLYPFRLEQQLPLADRRHAREVMECVGLPREAKFVCVHAREDGFKAQFQPQGHNRFRDIDIDTYLPAIRYLTEQNFWVVRMGESTVKPLPSMERVIEYARSPLKSDWLDVVLMAECECLLGCNSGFSQLAHLFNKRALWTNSIPIEMCPWDDLALWIPKLIFSKRDGRLLTFAEIIERGIGRYHRFQRYEADELEPRANSAEEILAATQELSRWTLGDEGSEEDRRAQRAFNQLFPAHYNAHGTRSWLCASFIRTHLDLMPATVQEAFHGTVAASVR